MRKTSDVRDTTFPFTDDRVAFIAVLDPSPTYAYGTKDGRGFEPASTYSKKEELLEQVASAEPGSWHLLAVWPGKARSDVFLVDDLEEAKTAFNL